MLGWLPSALARAVADQAEVLGASCACHCDGHHHDVDGEDAIRFVEGLEELTHIDAALDSENNRWTLPVGCRLTALFLGPAGTGKTSLWNLLSSKDAFGADGRGQSHTFPAVQRWQSSDGSLCLMDAVGFAKGVPSSEEVSQFLANTCLSAPGGFSMIFYVVKFGTISEESLSLLIFLTKYVFEASCLLNLYIVVTHAPSELLLHPSAATAWVQSQAEKDPGFKQVYTLAGRNPARFILVDTPPKPAGRRVRDVEEKRKNTARSFFHAFCDHPSGIVADFTTPLTREVQDQVKVQGRTLLETQLEVARLRGEMRRRPYGRKVLDHNEDSPTAIYQAQLWNIPTAKPPQPVLPSALAGADGEGNLKEERDLPSRLEKAEAAVLAAHEALGKRLMEVLRAAIYQDQVAVLVQRSHTRFLEDLRSASVAPHSPGRATLSQRGTSQTLLHSLKPLGEVPPKIKDSGTGFPVFAEIAAGMAAANVEDRLPCLIFDWDDTLCPTWWMRSTLPQAGQEASPTQVVKLALHAGRVEQVLRAARSFGSVDIVTLANRQWLEQTSRYMSPGNLDLLGLFDELQIQVHHAYSRTSPKAAALSPSTAIQAKKDAMANVLEKYYGDSIKARVHVLSFGDQDAEATAIQELVKDTWATSWQRPLCKVIRLPQDPDLQDLGKSLQKILTYLPALVRAENDLDLPLSRLDTMRW